jgi:hypothetical protein
MAARSKTLSAADMEKLNPQERADAVAAARTRSWEDVPEPFRTSVRELARQLGDQRRTM